MLAPETILQSRYHVIRVIGQGGMGSVYLATDQRLKNTVALKETFFTDEKLRRAFEHEAELLAGLHHPALTSVSDHFIEGDGQFLVMQFIPGDDLSELLKQKAGPFPVEEVLNWADQLLDALDYLHTQDPPVIHRDIKPQNLKVTTRGQIILLDFGLAKGTPLQISRVTASGSIFGYTPNYAPLEQIHGTGTDGRSDLYSLGATLYALITGGPPPDALSRATALISEQPDPLRPANELNPRVSAAVANVLMRAMAQNKTQRYEDAGAMRRALSNARLGIEESPITEAKTILSPTAKTSVDVAPIPQSPTGVVQPGGPTQPISAQSSPVVPIASIPVSLPIGTESGTETTKIKQETIPAKGFRWWMVAVPALLLLVFCIGGLSLYKALYSNSAQSDTGAATQAPSPAVTGSPVAKPTMATTSGQQSSPSWDGSTAGAKTQESSAKTKPTPKSQKGQEGTAESASTPPTPPNPGTIDRETQRQIDDAMRQADEAKHGNEQDHQNGRRGRQGRDQQTEANPDETQTGGKGQGPRTSTRHNPDGSTTTTILRPGGRVIQYTMNPDGSMRGKPLIVPRQP